MAYFFHWLCVFYSYWWVMQFCIFIFICFSSSSSIFTTDFTDDGFFQFHFCIIILIVINIVIFFQKKKMYKWRWSSHTRVCSIFIFRVGWWSNIAVLMMFDVFCFSPQTHTHIYHDKISDFFFCFLIQKSINPWSSLLRGSMIKSTIFNVPNWIFPF